MKTSGEKFTPRRRLECFVPGACRNPLRNAHAYHRYMEHSDTGPTTYSTGVPSMPMNYGFSIPSDGVKLLTAMLDPVCEHGGLSIHIADALRVVGVIDAWLWVINRAIVL